MLIIVQGWGTFHLIFQEWGDISSNFFKDGETFHKSFSAAVGCPPDSPPHTHKKPIQKKNNLNNKDYVLDV